MNLVVKESLINGLGAFLIKTVEQGSMIVDWSSHPLFQNRPYIPVTWRFKMIAPGVLSGPVGPEEFPDAYLNHSCDPNAEILFDRPKIHLIAKRKILADEEVTFDYATLYKAPWKMKCECGSAGCRGVVRGLRVPIP